MLPSTLPTTLPPPIPTPLPTPLPTALPTTILIPMPLSLSLSIDVALPLRRLKRVVAIVVSVCFLYLGNVSRRKGRDKKRVILTKLCVHIGN